MDVLRTLKWANLDLGFVNVFVTAVGGAFLVGCVKYLGGNDFWLGLMAAIPMFAGILQVPGAVWGKASASFKPFIAVGGWTWRLLYIPVTLLPLLPWPNELRLVILVACVGIGSAMVNWVGPTYNEWLSLLVPERNRGWYFSTRTLIGTAVGALSGVAAGFAMDRFKLGHVEGVGYAVVFGVGTVAGIISMVCFLQMVDVPRPVVVKANLSATIAQSKVPLQDRNLRRLLAFTGVFAASQSFAGNFFAAYALESLGLPFFNLTLTGLAHAVGTAISVRSWGYLSDKYGNKPVLSIAMVGVILTPLMWVACRPGQVGVSTVILLFGHVFNGVVWSAVGVAQFNLNMVAGRAEHRANSLALISAITAVCGGIAPMLGSSVLTGASQLTDRYHAYHVTFFGAALLRVVAMVMLVPVHERGATSVRSALSQLRRVRPSGVAALRAMQSSETAQSRAGAIAKVGANRMALATDELETALSDPSPKVRRHAAQALGRLGTREAGRALIQHIHSHPELVSEETLEALGSTGHRAAASVLVEFLDHPSALFRRTAARSLGRLGDHAAVAPLCAAAGRKGDPDLRRASVQALRELEVTTEGIDLYRERLRDTSIAVRSATAEAVSELVIKELADDLRQTLRMEGGEPLAEAVYALGCVGDLHDIPSMLACARDSQNRSTRRRCLLAVARLLAVEPEVYGLMSKEGMARDNQLFNLLRRAMRRSETVSEAVERYSGGEESQALALLAEARPGTVFTPLAADPVEEAFLVAVVAFVEREESSEATP